jgi:addiction module RelE/StbE family toxin
MAEVRWTDQSLKDVENIAEFIAQDSVRYAEIQVLRFFEATEILKTQPKAGRMVPEIAKNTVREVILGNYRIIYRIVASDMIHIIAVHHSARNLKNSSIK